MKKIFLTISLLAFSLIAAVAQSSDKMVLSLQQAKELGLKNRYDVKASKYNVNIAANDVTRAKRQWIPNINGSGGVRYNIQLQPTLIPGGFAGFPEPQLLALGAKNVTIFGLDLDQTIYNSNIGNDIKLARNNQALQTERTVGEEIQIKTQISQAYLNVQLRGLQYKIAINNEQRFKAYLDLAEGKYKNNALIETDFLRAKLDYENANIQVQVSKQNYELGLSNLKYQLNINDQTVLELSDSLQSDGSDFKPGVSKGEDSRTEVRQLKIMQQGNLLQLKKQRQYAIPMASLSGSYSTQFLGEKFNYGESQWWAPFSYVGVRITVPITGNIRNSNNIQESKLRSLQTDLQLQQKIADVNFEVQKATTELNNAMHNMQVSKANYDISDVIFQNQKQQFALGVFRYNDLLNTETSVSTAEQNYVTAVYNYLLAKLNYELAEGSL